jgi:penicillin-binding protein 1B
MSPRRKSTRTRKSPRARRWPWLLALLLLLGAAAGWVAYLDHTVRSTLGDGQWVQPAHVFARPLVFDSGARLDSDLLQSQLRQLGYRGRAAVERPGDYRASGGDYEIYARAFALSEQSAHARRIRFQLRGGRVSGLTVDGAGTARAWLEPMMLGAIDPRHAEDRLLLKLADTPRLLVDALLLVEDRDFGSHWGISPRGIARAALANLRAGATVQGGSTLTQQLVKNVFLDRERSLWRKAQEAVMALLVEVHYDKSQILEAYLNEIYLGQEGSRAIHGFGLAARHYFNRPLTELSPDQIALLVGMVKGPSLYNPWRRPERARERRDLVLELLAEDGLLSAAQLKALRAQPLGVDERGALNGNYPAYLDLVRRQLGDDYRADDLQRGGLRIFTALDPAVQQAAEQALATVMPGFKDANLEAAIVVTEVASGDVVAVVGGRRPRFAGFNRALDAVRPIGSLVKPAVYLAALGSRRYTLATPVSDAPVTVLGADGSEWKPRNYDRQSHGDVPLLEALAQSYNQATARLGMEIGLPEVVATLGDLGVTRKLPAVPALLLGAVELSPIEVAAMYQTIAADGRRTGMRSIVAVADSEQALLGHYPQRPRAMVEPPLMYLLQYALAEVATTGTAAGVRAAWPQGFAVAGKTGTTDDLRDSWFAGFSGDYQAVVWLGRDDNKAAGLTGSRGALLVWRELMARISREPLDLAPPAGVDFHWVDSQGRLANASCEGARRLPFLVGTEPRETSPCAPSVRGVLRWFERLFQ